MSFPEERPSFYLLNVGETHYPYALPDEPAKTNGRASAAFTASSSTWTTTVVGGKLSRKKEKFFDGRQADRCCASGRCGAVKYLDSVVEELFDMVPKNTYITITADHGELFGEDGYFGHGPDHAREGVGGSVRGRQSCDDASRSIASSPTSGAGAGFAFLGSFLSVARAAVLLGRV